MPGSFLRLNPHFLICETTNIFFNAAWVLRAAGFRGNAIVLAFEYLFALSFFPLRILNLSAVIWVLQTEVLCDQSLNEYASLSADIEICIGNAEC